ncbi:MAG: hypothetical protein IJT54_08460 [Candidatus Methanomethylophilaceae archaeon]|nr:hypothetical protein [Candidatus Methanomethylophilaceae archaeon]
MKGEPKEESNLKPPTNEESNAETEEILENDQEFTEGGSKIVHAKVLTNWDDKKE